MCVRDLLLGRLLGSMERQGNDTHGLMRQTSLKMWGVDMTCTDLYCSREHDEVTDLLYLNSGRGALVVIVCYY